MARAPGINVKFKDDLDISVKTQGTRLPIEMKSFRLIHHSFNHEDWKGMACPLWEQTIRTDWLRNRSLNETKELKRFFFSRELSINFASKDWPFLDEPGHNCKGTPHWTLNIAEEGLLFI